MEAIEAGKQVEKILIQKGLKSKLYYELMELLSKFDIPYQIVPLEKINRITRKNHQGVLALISPVSFSNLENLLPQLFENGETPLLLILDKVSDVRNFGAIVRSANCMGVHAIIVPTKGSARISSDAIKTSAGALHHTPVCQTKSIRRTLDFLKKSGIQIIAATEKTEQLVSDVDFTVPSAIIMGSEEKGIAQEFLEASDKLAQIPIVGEIASLNVSAAASIFLYEAVRQRK